MRHCSFLGLDGVVQPAPAPPPLWRDMGAWALLALGLAIQAYVHVVVLRETGGQGGAPLDDTYIHLTFARNLMRGEGFAFNPGEPVPGSTSPAWVVLLAATALRERWLPAVAILLGVFFYTAMGIAVWRLARWLGLGPAPAFFAAAAALLCGRLLWAGASGMEICAFAFFSLLGVGCHLGDRERGAPGPRTALALGVAAGFRPEGYLLFLISVLDHLIAFDPPTRQFRLTLRPYFRWRAVAAGAVFWLLIAPYMAFCLSTNGHIFPNTYYVKRNLHFLVPAEVHLRLTLDTLFDGRFGFLFLFLAPGILAQMILSYAGPAGRWEVLRRARILWLWPVGYTVACVLFNPNNLMHFGRYLMPLLPFDILLATIGLGACAEWLRMGLARAGAPKAGTYARGALAVVAAAIGLLAVSQIGPWARITARCVDNVDSQQAKIGRWIGETLPAQTVIAAHDVGAISFYGQRRIIDLFGLVSTDIMEILNRNREGRLADSPEIIEYVQSRRPDLIAAYPEWFPLCVQRPDAFHEIFEADLGKTNLICGGTRMQVWRADWDRYKQRGKNPD